MSLINSSAFVLLSLLVAAVSSKYSHDDVSEISQSDPVANERCFGCIDRRNHRDLYEHPTDCHKYYQCFYSGTGQERTAVGIERNCPMGQFWKQIIMQCVPEGVVPCEDRCSDPAVNYKGCYADNNNCASYFVCSEYTSYPFCCPLKTAFNPETCSCDDSETCKDVCTRKPILPATTVKPAEVFDDFCIDSWGNKLQPDTDSGYFHLVDGDGTPSRVKCATGSAFNLDKCSCSVNVDVPQQPRYRQCTEYLSFEENQHDHSIHNYFIDIVPPAEVSTEAAAHGKRSLRTGNGGRAEMPFKIGQVYNPVSVSTCRFFRCANPPCTYTSGALCSIREGASANGHDSYTGSVSFKANNVVRIEGYCYPIGLVSMEFPLPSLSEDAPNGFYQFCITSGPTGRRIYINRNLVLQEPTVNCTINPITCPAITGFDAVYGSFDGYQDDILECPYDIGEEGVIAHWNGKAALQALGMIP